MVTNSRLTAATGGLRGGTNGPSCAIDVTYDRLKKHLIRNQILLHQWLEIKKKLILISVSLYKKIEFYLYSSF